MTRQKSGKIAALHAAVERIRAIEPAADPEWRAGVAEAEAEVVRLWEAARVARAASSSASSS